METLEIKPDENFDGSFIDVVNPLMHNVSTSQIDFKNLATLAKRF